MVLFLVITESFTKSSYFGVFLGILNCLKVFNQLTDVRPSI